MLEKRNKTAALKVVEDSIPKPGQIAYTRQLEPLGLGHAIWCARNFVGSEPVAVLLADDLILSENGCLKQMIEAYNQVGGNMVAVMEVEKYQTSSYGIVTPGTIENSLIEVLDLIEKPKESEAPSNLAVIGRYILQPNNFNDLSRFEKGTGGEIQLTDSIARQVGLEPLNGFKFDGQRFDCGSKVGFLEANIAYALKREDLREPIQQFIQKMI